jgi:hypothetical protein
MIFVAPGTVMVISITGMPPKWMASTARRASSTFEARTTGTMPVSQIRFRTLSVVIVPLSNEILDGLAV